MLEVLFNQKNTGKILIFLFVNGKCYGTQIHRLLNIPLTPIQKILRRLENGGIILSEYAGKTKIFRFNPGFPLINELEQLLKKAYTFLSAQEKKAFYVAEEASIAKPPESKVHILLDFWEKLSSVKHLTFNATSKSSQQKGWNGKGTGQVIVTKGPLQTLIFTEKGIWKGKVGPDVNFSNTFRWTLDRAAGVISLEHLRRGIDHPVFLFHLVPYSKCSLSSIHPHLCDGDAYFGQVDFDQYGLRLNWRIIVPKKNEFIEYFFS